MGVFTIGLVGTLVLAFSKAATPTSTFEVENGSRIGSVTELTDASASNGKAIRFSSGGSGFQANCITKPSVCGYPDETNTGVPAGTQLTNATSITVNESYISANGGRGPDGRFVLSEKNISEQIVVSANNVTIKNTRITTNAYYPIDYNGYTGLLVEDTEIKATSPSVTAGIGFSNYTARRIMITGSSDGIKADDNVLVEDSYITQLCQSAGSHNDGVQFYGNGNVTLRHNTIKGSVMKAAGVDGCTAPQDVVAIQINSGAANSVIENNLIDSHNALWSINGAGASTLQIRNNRFTKSYSKYPDAPWSVSASQSSGNYYDDTGLPAN